MKHRIKSVKTLDNYILSVTFQNGIIKEYDMKELFTTYPQFKEFMIDEELYELVQVDIGGYGVSWNDDLDLDAEEIWEDGREVDCKEEIDIISLAAVKLTEARSKAGMTQKQLAEVTGIYQADISKIERGLANPSLTTLQRLAKGLGMQIDIDFRI